MPKTTTMTMMMPLVPVMAHSTNTDLKGDHNEIRASAQPEMSEIAQDDF